MDLPPNEPRYPFELAWFGSELRIVAAAASYDVALGAQVVGIDGITLDSAMALVSRLVPRGENEGRTRLTATMLLTSPQVLRGLDLAPTRRQAAVDLVTSTGNQVTEMMAPVKPARGFGWRFANEHPPLWLPGLRVSYSTRHYRFGADSSTAVDPDRRIESHGQDFRSGDDPVLD